MTNRVPRKVDLPWINARRPRFRVLGALGGVFLSASVVGCSDDRPSFPQSSNPLESGESQIDGGSEPSSDTSSPTSYTGSDSSRTIREDSGAPNSPQSDASGNSTEAESDAVPTDETDADKDASATSLPVDDSSSVNDSSNASDDSTRTTAESSEADSSRDTATSHVSSGNTDSTGPIEATICVLDVALFGDGCVLAP